MPYLQNIPRIAYIVPVILLIGSYFLYQHHQQIVFESIHDNEVLFKYIDQMNVNDLRNKMKLCVIDQTNCTFVFAEK